MKLSIRRHGIVIRAIEIEGDRAKIGAGDDCEIKIDDPYLAPHVGDIERRDDGWYIVDPATSLEGISRDGRRIDEEPLAFDQAYSIGGFEMVAEGDQEDLPAGTAAGGESAAIPGTVFETPLPGEYRESPKTMYEGALSGRDVPHTVFEEPFPSDDPVIPRTVYQAMPSPDVSSSPQPAQSQPSAAPAARAGARKRRLMIIAALGGFLLVLLIAVAIGRKDSPPQVAAEPAAEEVATVAPEKAPETVEPSVSPEALAAELKLDELFQSWEEALAKAPDAALQQRYAATALELGLVHAAGNEAEQARGYFEKVVKFGPADSNEVAIAKRKLAQ